MSNARKGTAAHRSDPTRTAKAKREAIAKRTARMVKGEHYATALDLAALQLELSTMAVAR